VFKAIDELIQVSFVTARVLIASVQQDGNVGASLFNVL
jgi:hypothetical protein